MFAKIVAVCLLCVTQLPAIFADANMVKKEYAPIIHDCQYKLEEFKVLVGLNETKIRNHISNIIGGIEQYAHDRRQEIIQNITEKTEAINCSELQCEVNKENDIYYANIESMATIKTCIGLFSNAVDERLVIFPMFYEKIDRYSANISQVNELCTKNNATSNEMRLCFFEELSYNSLLIDYLKLEGPMTYEYVLSIVNDSEVRLNVCSDISLKQDIDTTDRIVPNYESCCQFNSELRDIIILILSQEDTYNSQLSHNLEQNIIKQSQNANQAPPLVYLSHRDFPHIGDWTILPLLPPIANQHKQNSTWVFICTERTHINIKSLINILNKHNNIQEVWLGYALHDREVTIIHHFAFYEDPTKFLYPNLASGFAISMPLLIKLADRFSLEQQENPDNGLEFSIDASHELSLFIWNKGSGISIIHEPNFCIDNQKGCASFVTNFKPCGEPVPSNAIYFAIKTCSKFHDDRVTIVKKTWAQYTSNINFFSDIEDKNIPTISLNIPNTEYGHCAKTFAIIKHAYNELKTNDAIKWVAITDDDTILSSYRLRQLLSCYKNNEILALGERYGYRVQSLDQKGYNYITGGGGTVLSSKLVEKIVQNTDLCSCPRSDSPDDMFLGVCLARLGVKVTHSPQFHQARPNDYAHEYLSENDAISFHKHWMINPQEIYRKWFEKSDKYMAETMINTKIEL